MRWITWPQWSALDGLLTSPYMACLLILLLRAARKGNRDARFLIVPMVLWAAGVVSDFIAAPLLTTGHLKYAVYLTYRRMVSWPMPVAFPVFAEFLIMLSVLFVVVLRFARNADRTARELETMRMTRSS